MRIIKKAALLFISLSSMAFSFPKIWDGTADTTWYNRNDSTFSLSTAEQLAGLAKITSRFRSWQKIILVSDIFLNDTTGAENDTWGGKPHRQWTPIGSGTSPFGGEFDGQGHKIYGLYINDAARDYAGFLGYTKGNISNLEIKVGFVKANNYVGSVVGQVWDCSKISYYPNGVAYSVTGGIANISSEISVEGNSYVGGLIGSLIGENKCSITSSTYKGNVFGTGIYVGGLVGYGNEVSKSFVEGSVKSDSNYVGGIAGCAGPIDSAYHIDGDVEGLGYVGGVVGFASDSITNSNSEGRVVGVGNYVGGLVGNGTRVSKSFAKGTVTGAGMYVGGLIGYTTRNISDSHFEGDVVAESDYVGGLAGYTKGFVSKSHFSGDVVGAGNYVGGLIGYGNGVGGSGFSGHVSGVGNYVGGLAGYTTGTVSGSNFKGDVSSSGNYVGGLIGLSFHNETTQGERRLHANLSSTGNVRGNSYVGGAIGLDSIYLDTSDSNFTGSRTIANVNVDGTVEGKTYVGGIVGRTKYSSKISNFSSYFEFTVIIDSCQHGKGNVIGSEYVGGLFGSSYGYTSNSHSEGNVIGIRYVGGLGGASGSSVKNSYSIGDVVGTGDYVGGLLGNTSGYITRSHFVGSVDGNKYVGGLVGKTNRFVSHSYSKGNVVGISYVGGLVGDGCVINTSYMEGNVYGDSGYVGGLAGHTEYYIDSSYFIGGEVKGYYDVGGLIGYKSNRLGAQGGGVYNSFVLGDVFAYGDGGVVGGLVGYYSGKKDTIYRSFAIGNVSGNNNVGGLLGISYQTSFFINESYISENVTALDGDSVGCVFGVRSGGSYSVKSSYYDKTKCSQGFDYGLNGRTTAQMQTQKTFGWDFNEIWKIADGITPFLRYYTKLLNSAIVATDSLEEFVYDGKAKKPTVKSVELFGDLLIKETDYTIEYINNVNAGTASINICGMGQYEGCKVVDFEIQPYDGKPSIDRVGKAVYTGEAQIPKIAGYYETPPFKIRRSLADSNYTLTFKDNVNAGLATVVLNMVGNYTGTATTTFIIEKAVPEIAESPSASDVLLNETLASSELSGGLANTEGLFVWKSPDTYPKIENSGYIVTFVPRDTSNYESIELVVPIKVWDVASVIARIGNVTVDSVVLVKGSNYILPEPPDSTGYDFVGFYKGNVFVGNPGESIVVNENTIIKAIYAIKKFVVKFVNDGAEMQSGNVAYGEIPTYNGVEPSKPETAQYAYIFKDWAPVITPVTGNVTYTAVYDSIINKYDVMFMDYKGMVLSHSTYAYGTDASQIAKPDNPKRDTTAKYIYTFKGWTPSVTSVTDNATYTAVFDSTLRKYSVSFVSDGSVLETVDVVYGETPKYSGETPTKPSTKSYSYEFAGWSPKLAPVEKDLIYTAVFDSTVITGIADVHFANQGLSVKAVNRNIQISTATIGSAYVIFDMQGRVLRKGRVDSANFNIAMPIAGNYLVKIGNQLRHISVK